MLVPEAWSLLHLLVLLVVLGNVEADDQVCNGRGHLGNNDKCVCDSEWPLEGQFGWAGPDCTMKVYGASFSEGTDLTDQCKSQACNFLNPDQWICFAVNLDFHSTIKPWNHLTVQLERISDDESGDPDLYGMFYNTSSSTKGKHLDNTTYSYDFRETSSSSHRTVVKKVNKHEFINPNSDYKGVYLCVKAYGEANVTFGLRATATRCPSDFTETGQQLVCSSPVGVDSEKRYSECTQEGECICKPPYAKPVDHPYDFLGFEDCSAKVTMIPDSDLTLTNPFVKEHELLEVKGWSFYAFNVTQNDYQIVVNLAGEKDEACSTAGYFGLFVKYGQPPGWRYGEWDYRPEWDYYGDKDKATEIRFDQTMEGFHTGTWYTGVNGDDVHSCKYTMTISKFECPLNCNGRGTCVHNENGTRSCQCFQNFFGIDCSREAHAMEFGKIITTPESGFEYEFFQLPAVTAGMLTHNVEVQLAVSYSSTGYTEWAAALPELLLLKGDDGSMPTSHNYTFKQVLERQNTTYEINLCPSQLSEGNWRAAIYNPMRVYKMAYNLSAEKHAHCLNNCSQNGVCNQDGQCQCHGDWRGGDCSIDLSSSCVQGTRKAIPKPDQRGTCLQECVCRGDNEPCTYGGKCTDFICDDASWRRKGVSDECVQDRCTKDEWFDADDHICLRSCTCPSDGSACHLDDECSREHFECKQGYHRASETELVCKQSRFCRAGDFQISNETLKNGRLYRPCNCTQDPCSFVQSAPSDMVVVCNEGYAHRGGHYVMEDGVAAMIGGECVRVRKGTPGWGVFLWVFFSLIIGAIGGMAVYWYYENRYRRGGPLSEGLYHELSMDTGF